MENKDVIINDSITDYLKNIPIENEIINIFSQLLPEIINKPLMDIPIITFEDLKNIVVEKVDLQLIKFQKKLNKYKDQDFTNDDEKKKLQFFLDYLKLNLNDDAKILLNWYLEMEAKKKELTKQENYLAQETYKEKNKNNFENHNG